MVRPLEWSGPLSGQPFGGSAIGALRVSYIPRKNTPTRAATAAVAAVEGGIESGTTMEGCQQCVPGVRGILVVTPCRIPIVLATVCASKIRRDASPHHRVGSVR